MYHKTPGLVISVLTSDIYVCIKMSKE